MSNTDQQTETPDAELPAVQSKEERGGDRAVALRSAPIKDIERQAKDVQNLLDNLMKPDEHYGKIFDNQKKPTLLQPGAEKLCSAFGMTPEYDVETVTVEADGVPWGHREIRVKCSLFTRGDHVFLGQGVGSCSTLEPKYRYRSAEETTDVTVPNAFWDSGDNNSERNFDILRNALDKAQGDYPLDANLGTEKVEGTWYISYKAGRTENPDPAAEWNTVLKMAKKRALVDAVKTATAASDIFTQDIEDMEPEQLNGGAPPRPQNRKAQRPQKQGPTPQQQERKQADRDRANPEQDPNHDAFGQGIKNIRARLKQVEQDPDGNLDEAVGGALSYISNWPPQEWKRAAAVIREFAPNDANIPDTPPSADE